MTIQTCTCECGREFMVNEDYDLPGRCAVCVAYDGKRGPGEDFTHREEARLQELADIKVALRELADVLDKWRP